MNQPRFHFNTIGLFTTDNARMVTFYRDVFGFTTDWNGLEPNVEMHLGEMRLIMFPRTAFEEMISQKLSYPNGRNGTMELSFDVTLGTAYMLCGRPRRKPDRNQQLYR